MIPQELSPRASVGRPGAGETLEEWPLSDGEIHYFWWFIQGSIMDPGIRWKLRRAWGMCERHAWGALAVEAAFRREYLHGPALLYEDLMGRALGALRIVGPRQVQRVGRRLRAAGPCLVCEMGLGPTSRGAARPELVEEGRDASALRAFVDRTREYWRGAVCGRCAGSRAGARCRPHLLEEISRGRVADIREHRVLVEGTLKRLAAYARSFRWECRNTETDEDRAALISAVGWCSGWGVSVPFVR